MKKIFTFLLGATLIFAICDISFARKGSSFGGSRSSGSSSKPSSSWSSKPSTSTRPSSPTSKPSTAATKSKEAVQTKGKTFSNKSEAVSQFKKDNAAKYTAKYNKEPVSRPSHIPQSTKVGNQNVNITYNSGYGGYGYMHPTLGTWMMYDALSDAVMLSTLMSRDNYIVSQQVSNTQSTVATSHFRAAYVFSIILSILFLALVVYIIYHVMMEA